MTRTIRTRTTICVFYQPPKSLFESSGSREIA
jgi:hypothetical protein